MLCPHCGKKIEESLAAPVSDELIQSEKLAFTGRIAANIAHEIRNPLTNVRMAVQQLPRKFKSKDARVEHIIEIILKNTERINYLITELLNCARPPKLEIGPGDIHGLLRSVLESTKSKIESKRVKVVEKFSAEPSEVNVDKEHMERAFLNLIDNAVEAIPRRGTLTVSTQREGNFITVRIQDTGKGIREEDIIRIFDPFFSTKRDGIGLGLTICYGIIVSHGGTIAVESKMKQGSVFTVLLPAAPGLKKSE